ncbi:hypothetical protein PN36_03520 [Candidatus Thiomargarita nelsonii]|uniref:Gingipain domain-containing protein n=1 Tax=Candidatus Thiomargarita nelsonii TaxID=1003181 RepID=A0A0A6PD30_9GAMM|nr:hypothetical protein PN36_03520 [Candidatus Thiomargarita nelsonii]
MNKSFSHSVFLIFLLLVPSYAVAEIRVLDENPHSLILELTVSDPIISDENLSDQIYQTINIPGMGHSNQPGKPQLPNKGTLIAVPSDSQIQLEIIEQETQVLSNILLAPASDRILPSSPVEIGMTGYIREQRVAQIQFFPVRYNPVQKTVEIDKSLRVKVSFLNNNKARSGKVVLKTVADSPAFEKMLDQLLLNDRTVNQVLRSRSAKTREDCPSPLPPALKLSIDKTGVYALTYSYFQEKLGLELSVVDARQIYMSHQGEAVPIFIAGEEDGVFGPGDVMFFYAQAGDTPYTRTNIYWLSLKADGSARLSFRDATPDPSHPPLTEFKKTVHVERDDLYWVKLPKDPEKDHLFWSKINATNSHNMSLNMRHIAPGTANATIRVMMQGRTDDRSYDPDHHTQILLNDVNISDEQWNGQMEFLQEGTIPQSSIPEGHTVIQLLSVGDTGAQIDNLYVNWLEVDYIATMTAISDQLTFEAVSRQGAHQLTVGGFTSPEIFVLDVTKPEQIALLFGGVVQKKESRYQIQYSDNLKANKIYYTFSFAEEILLKPADISIDVPSRRLQSPCHQADYFIIHHDSFNVDALKNLVMGRGLGVMAVPVSDIYDEFNHGMPDPRAIKDFLVYAYENYSSPAPAYVALVGDANQDLLNELGHGINYIPTNLFYTALLGITATDNDYVTVSGDDDLPDMFLGRMPVRSQKELDAIVNKLSRYSQAALDGWQQNVLFVTDNDPNFDETANELIEKYFAGYASQIYLSQYSGADAKANAKQDIIQHLNTGALITSYIGHGSVGNWAGLLFKSSDVELLGNSDKLTFLMTLNCINGWFSFYQAFDGHDDSLAEAFLKADDKGAVGVWAPTGQGFTFEHERLADEFFRLLLQEGVTAVGPLTTQAKIAAVVNEPHITSDNLKIFTLFGDPSLPLRLE